MFAANKNNVVSQNIVSQSFAIVKNNLGQVVLLSVCMLLLGYCLALNFSAIGQMVSFGTGLHPFMAIVTFFGLLQIIKYSDIQGDGVGKYVSQCLYLVMSLIGLYWVFVYSDWETYKKTILTIFQLVIYSTIVANMFVDPEEDYSKF